ncbi:MAG: hypothetical protein FJ143_16420 [Deltaproteobacteria bacterium]|nr:hypothetical protein [Deltaproteobacteria bacterium]
MISFAMLLGPLSLAAGILLLLVLLAGFLWLTGKLEGYDPVNEMMFRDNGALGIRYALFAIAVVLALLGIFDRSQGDTGAWFFAQHGLLALFLIYLSRHLNDRLILYHFDNNREVVQEKNSAVAIVEGATYLASAQIIGAAFADWEDGLVIALEWFAIGQLLFIALALLYRAVDHGVHDALDGKNLAVGISLGSYLFAGGIICGALISGPSQGWRQDLVIIGAYLATWIVLMVAAHVISNLLVFRSSRLGEEVVEQRNIAAALFKAVIFLAVT